MLNMIKEKFTSGNGIPVERITITRAEYENALSKPEPRNDAAWYWHDMYKAKCEEIEFGFALTPSPELSKPDVIFINEGDKWIEPTNDEIRSIWKNWSEPVTVSEAAVFLTIAHDSIMLAKEKNT